MEDCTTALKGSVFERPISRSDLLLLLLFLFILLLLLLLQPPTPPPPGKDQLVHNDLSQRLVCSVDCWTRSAVVVVVWLDCSVSSEVFHKWRIHSNIARRLERWEPTPTLRTIHGRVCCSTSPERLVWYIEGDSTQLTRFQFGSIRQSISDLVIQQISRQIISELIPK